VPDQSTSANPISAFGPNEWLVDELYEQYQRDKHLVDKAWWEFFADYTPEHASVSGKAAAAAATLTSHAAAAPTAVAPPAAAAPATPAPAQPTAGPAPTPRDITRPQAPPAQSDAVVRPLKGPAARVVTNMQASLDVPTATSVRSVPAKLLIDNRVVINNHLARSRGGKVSFTHLIGYAMVKALAVMPEMNYSYAEQDGKPVVVQPAHINLGLAIDLAKPDGTRQLLVPSIKSAESMDFVHFWSAYEEMVKKARAGKLTVDDFAGTSISLTNPGTIGTVHSVPRLMQGQGAIIGVGAMEYPAEWAGASSETLNRNAVSKILTLTSTYDHRIIQGAQSGDFLRIVHQLLLGAEDFYDEIFESSLRIPYEPVRWVQDIDPRTTTTSTRSPGCRSSSTPTGCAATSWPTPTRWSTASAATPTSTSPNTG
jgi:2-oxoglutarate decarboxylase